MISAHRNSCITCQTDTPPSMLAIMPIHRYLTPGLHPSITRLDARCTAEFYGHASEGRLSWGVATSTISASRQLAILPGNRRFPPSRYINEYIYIPRVQCAYAPECALRTDRNLPQLTSLEGFCFVFIMNGTAHIAQPNDCRQGRERKSFRPPHPRVADVVWTSSTTKPRSERFRATLSMSATST